MRGFEEGEQRWREASEHFVYPVSNRSRVQGRMVRTTITGWLATRNKHMFQFFIRGANEPDASTVGIGGPTWPPRQSSAIAETASASRRGTMGAVSASAARRHRPSPATNARVTFGSAGSQLSVTPPAAVGRAVAEWV